MWSDLILRTVFTFFASFCSSACWKWFILMACRVDTVGIQLRHPGGARAGVLRKSPGGSVWHVDPYFLRGSMGICSLVCAAVAFCLSLCSSYCFHSRHLRDLHESLTNWTYSIRWGRYFSGVGINAFYFFFPRFEFNQMLYSCGKVPLEVTFLQFCQFHLPNKLFLLKHPDLIQN